MKILLIDDDENCLKSIAKSLEINGISSIRFTSPEQAVSSLRAGEYSVLVTDIKMPGMNGFEVIKAAKQIDPGLPVVILSAHDEERYVQTAKQLGAHTFFHKSVPFGTFLETLVSLGVSDGMDDHSTTDSPSSI